MRYAPILNLKLFVLLSVLVTSFVHPASAAWPWTKYEGSPRIDPIPPIGNRLPPSYRAKYNRPTYIGGKIAAKIEPSSQEAMAFRRSESLGLYDHTGIKGWFHGKNCPPQRVEQHYFYPKPWEALAIGARRDVTQAEPTDSLDFDSAEEDSVDELPDPVRSMDLGEADEIMELPVPLPEADLSTE